MFDDGSSHLFGCQVAAMQRVTVLVGVTGTGLWNVRFHRMRHIITWLLH